MKRIALRTYIGLGLGLGFGLLPFVVFLLPSVEAGIPDGPALTETLVLCASLGIANFVLAAVGLALFWAVRDLRLHWAWAVLLFVLFVGVAIVSLFVPRLLMRASRLFWPYIFTGDGGFALGLAPYFMVPFAVATVIAFAISLVFARWHSHVAPSQPSASSRGSQAWLLRGSLLGVAAVIVCAILVLSFLGIRSRLAHPDDPGGCVKLGVAAYEQGHLDEAIAQYRKALEAKPNDPEAHYRIGAVLASRHRVDEAMAHFRKALDIKPDYPEVHYHLGLVLADRGRLAEAITEYRKALELKPDYEEARQNLNKAIETEGRDRGVKKE